MSSDAALLKEDKVVEKIVGDRGNSFRIDDIDLTPKLHKVDLSETGVIDKNLKLYMDFYALVYNTPTKTHKGDKAKASLEWCVNNKVDIALFGNFSKEISSLSEGSGMDALDFFSQFYDIDVVGFVPLKEDEREPYIVIESGGKGKERIRIHIDGKPYYSPKRLEQIFRCILDGKAEILDDPLGKLYQSGVAEEVSRIAKSKKDNPIFKAITNIYEFDPYTKAYFFKNELKEKLGEMDIIIRPVGTGESLLGQIKSLKPTYDENRNRVGPIHMGVTTYGNPLAGWLTAIGSEGNNRLDTPYSNPAHEVIKGYMQDPRYDIRLLIMSESEKTISGGVATRLKSSSIGDLAISETGSYGPAALLKKNCMTQGQYIKDLEIEGMFPGYSPFDGVVMFLGLKKYEGDELRDSELVLPRIGRKYQVCVVYTGCSKKVT